jgi:hypothetical protein
MKKSDWLKLLAVPFAAVLIGVAGCDTEETEELEAETEGVIDNMGDAADDVGNDMQEGLDEFGDDVDDARDDLEDDADSMVE